ncbi:hypothetical protein BD309DRAFT_972631 [Dichomitus squalens]|nr:hypothetical protein BD309DRAFT_972631 [Dichomitus squalens]
MEGATDVAAESGPAYLEALSAWDSSAPTCVLSDLGVSITTMRTEGKAADAAKQGMVRTNSHKGRNQSVTSYKSPRKSSGIPNPRKSLSLRAGRGDQHARRRMTHDWLWQVV